ncbi:MAG: glycosyltransferase family 4 protein [Deltaproteobacteria bacterium]|nr:glycosyltransferase family 4 protein [Candidatus Zymogenaceae bacterium]
MRILINTSPLVTPLTGIGHYVANLIHSMVSLEPSHEYFFFNRNYVSSELKSSQTGTGIPAKPPFYSGILPQKITYGLRRLFLSALFLKSKYNVYHETNYFPPREIPFPTISTIYDLSVQIYPQYHPIDRVRMFEKHFLKYLSSYRYIIAISNNTKNDLVRVSGYPEERIGVVYPGYHGRFRVVSQASVKKYIEEKKLPSKYILFLGTLDPRKNIRLLLDAYTLLNSSLREKYHIVLAGWKGWDYEGVFRRIDDLGIRSSTIYLGYVRDDEVPLLYNGASLFVYPSFYEGFGLPLLEAMACGCPVITTNASSLPEVVGDGGVMVDPYDEYGMRDKMEMILTDDKTRTGLREYGLKRVGMFSWETCAQHTLDVYKKAAD